MSDEWSSSSDDVNANGEKSSMLLWKMKRMMLKTMVFMQLNFLDDGIWWHLTALDDGN
jgi:hypothetical protein